MVGVEFQPILTFPLNTSINHKVLNLTCAVEYFNLVETGVPHPLISIQHRIQWPIKVLFKMMIPASIKSKRTHNPIRHIVDNLKPPVDHPKKMLNLALGDPTVHGNLSVPSAVVDAIHDLLNTHTVNGYLPAVGLPSARKAIAQYSTVDGFPVSEDDVVIASGCSGAIELILSALINEGETQ